MTSTGSTSMSGFTIDTSDQLEFNIFYDYIFGENAGTNWYSEGLIQRLNTTVYGYFFDYSWPLLGGTNC